MKRKTLLLLMLCAFFSTLKAQSNLTIDQSYTVEEMVTDFFNHPDITISNVSFTGVPESYAFFDSGEPTETILGVGAGIFIGSGFAEGAIGPNTAAGYSGQTGGDSDDDLSMLATNQSLDASVITFELTASSELLLDFNYVFGSEEYCEYVNSGFNDVFGFFVSGPGITGPFTNDAVNIATVPGAADYVGINSINHEMNSNLFLPNSESCNNVALDPENLQYDGFTTPLAASFLAMAGETYQIRLGVSDIGDGIFDSGVFLSFNSLSMDSVLVPPAQFVANNTFTNGAEFVNNSKYATSYFWDFGNGLTSTAKDPAPITYDSAGVYEVSLTTQNYCCTDVQTQMVSVSQIAININPTTTNNPLACAGDSNAGIELDLSGGTGPYNVAWFPTVTDQMNLSAGAYTVVVTDAVGDTNSTTVEITEPDQLSIDIMNSSTTETMDDLNNGSATVAAIGGTPPYTYLWETGETTETIENLAEGAYEVEITDTNGCSITFVIGVGMITNVNEANNFTFQLFPNPAKDHLTLSWTETTEIESIQMFDVLGGSVGVNYNLSGSQIEIGFQNDPAVGIYYLKVQLTDGRSGVERFMIR